MTGIVKWFSAQKGYGFITSDAGGEVFVHHQGLALECARDAEGKRNLNTGDKVTFLPEVTQKGIKAVDVLVTKSAPLRAAAVTRHSKCVTKKDRW